MRKSFSGFLTLPGLLSVLFIGVVVGLIVSATADLPAALHADRGEVKLASAQAAERSPSDDSPFTQIASSAAPGVVFIEVKREASAKELRDMHQGMPFDEMFRQLFPSPEGNGQGDDGQGDESQREPTVIPSAGSGFFIDKAGLIMTNNHVVHDAEHIRVRVSRTDGDRYYDAELVGQDPATDIAVIRVKDAGAGDFPALPMGNSDNVQVGDWAIAVGNPFGTLEGTVTVGVISAKGRTDLNIMGGTPVYQDFLQTDASINFGNSGGPLLNKRGEVIGINTAINPSGQGIGFAIPINLARDVAQTLAKEGHVTRGFIGVLPQELSADLAEGMGLKAHEGVLVGNVVGDGPADKAGLQSGDVITSFNGEKVSDVSKFRMLVANQPVNRTVDVHYLRDGKESSAKVTVAERKDETAQAQPKQKKENWLGIEVEEVSGAEAEHLGIKTPGVSVVVSHVTSGSPADDAGIQEGDVIRKIAGHSVKSTDDYRKISSELKDRDSAIPFLVERNGMSQFVAVKPGK